MCRTGVQGFLYTKLQFFKKRASLKAFAKGFLSFLNYVAALTHDKLEHWTIHIAVKRITTVQCEQCGE